MHRSPKPLYDLLLSLFRSNDDPYEFLVNYDYSRATDLVNSLPATTIPRTTYTMRAVENLQAHGIDQAPFFDSLAEQYPGRKDLYAGGRAKIYRRYHSRSDRRYRFGSLGFGTRTHRLAIDCVREDYGRSSAFLDVAYLALGYERAKSVAKLRMRFSDVWYSGTAFLVGPDTLFTAYHNLWMGGGAPNAWR